MHDAVATSPETATCVAVRRSSAGLEVCAPHGLADLLGGVWRANPIRGVCRASRARLASHRQRWPFIEVVDPL